MHPDTALAGLRGGHPVATAICAYAKGWPVVIPPRAWAGGLAAAVIIGAAAGLLAVSGQTQEPGSVSFPAPTFWQVASYLVDDRRELAGMQPDPAVADLESFLAERGEPLLRTAVLLAGSKEAGEDLLQVDGVDAIKLTGSNGVVLWIDPSTYLPVRQAGPGAGVTDFRWYRATEASRANLKVAIPPGFRRVPAPRP